MISTRHRSRSRSRIGRSDPEARVIPPQRHRGTEKHRVIARRHHEQDSTADITLDILLDINRYEYRIISVLLMFIMDIIPDMKLDVWRDE